MKKKPRLTFWQIWNMSFGFFGIQFGFALQNANVSRIFQTLGAEVEDIPVLWIAAPVTGLIVQPVIGHLSDKTWNRLGRRRPYFLTGAIMASLALLAMPNSPALWIAAGMLWIMDASINISMEPFRAFVGDMLPAEQHTRGFAMQSFFIGSGAVIASALPWMMTNWFDIANTAPEGVIPPSVRFAFYTGAAVFFLAVAWTVFSTREYPPEELSDPEEQDSAAWPESANRPWIRHSLIWIPIGLILNYIIYTGNLEKELYILGVGLVVFGMLQMLTGLLLRSRKAVSGFTEIMTDLFAMPGTMKQLAIVQFFSWFALFAMWIYTTPAVTAHHFLATDTSSAAYNEGADWVGILMGVYNGFAALTAFLLPVLARYTNRKFTHLIALSLGGLGLISFYFIRDPYMLIWSELGIGIAWASILAMPYAILTGALPPRKMGVYMGIFNFFIVIPQIVAASLLGFLVERLFDGRPILALVLGGISMIMAGIITLTVEDTHGS